MSETPTPPQGLPDKYEARVRGSPDAIRSLLEKFDVDVGCRRPHIDQNKDGSLTLLFYASEAQLDEIGRAEFTVERGDNVSAIGRERQSEIGKGDRFDGGKRKPTGIGVVGRSEQRGDPS